MDDDGAASPARRDSDSCRRGGKQSTDPDELIDAAVLRSRFEADNLERQKLGLHVMPIDEYLLAALPNMTECSGIALGVDRLLMIATQQMKLEKVITFPADVS